MIVYRIAKSENWSKDISGLGAFLAGGRWNNAGTYLLYTSENISLAYLENLVHFDALNVPPNLYVIEIEVNVDESEIFMLPDTSYPKDWQEMDNLDSKSVGDRFIVENEYLAMKVRSSVNVFEFNFLLNPLFPHYHDKVHVISAKKLKTDFRLL